MDISDLGYVIGALIVIGLVWWKGFNSVSRTFDVILGIVFCVLYFSL